MGNLLKDVSRETQARLTDYIGLLIEWNRALNLVSKRDLAPEFRDRHLSESLAFLPHLPAQLERFIDLGSGGGFPALPIAIATDCYVELIEADQRKAAFLQTVLATVNVRGKVWVDRIEACLVPPAQCITARALAPLPMLLHYSFRLLAPGGVALFLKGDRAGAEMADARHEWKMQVEQTHLSPHRSRILKISGLERVHDPSQ